MDQTEQEKKQSKRNTLLMIIIAILFTIGIITRWGYISSNVKESINHYLPSQEHVDSILKQGR